MIGTAVGRQPELYGTPRGEEIKRLNGQLRKNFANCTFRVQRYIIFFCFAAISQAKFYKRLFKNR